MTIKVRDMLRCLAQDGWRVVAFRGSHRQLKHAVKRGRVTVSGSPADDLSDDLIGSILRQAGLTKADLHR